MSLRLKKGCLDLGRIAGSGQCFTWRPLAGGGYGIPVGERYVEARQEGEELVLSCSQEEFDGFWRAYFDWDRDYEALLTGIDPADTYLTAAAAHGYGIRVLRQDLWEVLACFLISQNNNITRITRSVHALSERWGRELSVPGMACGHVFSFPTPEQLSPAREADYQAAGLGYRAKYMVRLAKELSGGGLARWKERLEGLEDREAEQALMELYGVGKKVADCVCLFGLHRADFFPVDTHIRKIFHRYYPEGFPRERYRGSLGILQQYMFYYDLRK